MCTVMCISIVALCLHNITSAHTLLVSPRPIEVSAPKDLLKQNGIYSTCHAVTLPSEGGRGIAAGSSFKMKPEVGTKGEKVAEHDGGSCRVPVTYETSPMKVRDPSSWHIIQGMEGGYPASSAGNLRDSRHCTSSGK